MTQANGTLTLIVMVTVQDAVDREATLEAKLRTGMKEAAHHYMVTDPDTQLRGVIAAVFKSVGVDSEDGLRLQHELRQLDALSSVLRGVPVDMQRVLADGPEPIGIIPMWREAKGL